MTYRQAVYGPTSTLPVLVSHWFAWQFLARITRVTCVLLLSSLTCLYSQVAKPNNEPETPSKIFSILTPSPITDYSVLSTEHLDCLRVVFADLGYELRVTYDRNASSLSTFKGERYDGAIFIGTGRAPEDGVEIDKPLELADLGFFTLAQGKESLTVSPTGLTIVASKNGKHVLAEHFPELVAKNRITTVRTPQQILRVLQSGRADIGFSALNLLTADGLASTQFAQLPTEGLQLPIKLYIQKDYQALKQDIEQALVDNYLPSVANKRNQTALISQTAIP